MLKSNTIKKNPVISTLLSLLISFNVLTLNFGCYASNPKNQGPDGCKHIRTQSVVPNTCEELLPKNDEDDANQPNNSNSDPNEFWDLNASLPPRENATTTNANQPTTPKGQSEGSNNQDNLANDNGPQEFIDLTVENDFSKSQSSDTEIYNLSSNSDNFDSQEYDPNEIV